MNRFPARLLVLCAGIYLHACCVFGAETIHAAICSAGRPAGKTAAGNGFAGIGFAGQLIDTVTCKADPTQSYALYIPPGTAKGPMPALYFFDPHGNGSLPVGKYKSLADAYGFILIGSNNSKNGNDWSAARGIWSVLSDDTQKRWPIDRKRIYTGGFSGGAKVAGYIAIMYPVVKGILVNGAGLPDGVAAADFDFSVTAIAGEGDMNLTELVAISKDLDHTHTRHRILFFDGKHEWAPPATMSLAFEGLQFDAMKRGLIPVSEPVIRRYLAESRKRLDEDYQSGQFIKARRECSLSISFLDGLTPEAAWFGQKAASLDGDARYQKQRQMQERLLVKEEDIKTEYARHFQQSEMPYWTATIDRLKKDATRKDAETAMHQRLLAYLSLAFYSFSSRLINSNGNREAAYFVALYKLADPANSEAWYFSALLHARSGNSQAAEDDLLKAAACGLLDKRRMRQQPEFQGLSPKLHFARIEAAMVRTGAGK